MNQVEKPGFTDEGGAGLLFFKRKDLGSVVFVKRFGIYQMDWKTREGDQAEVFEVFGDLFVLSEKTPTDA
jgi:hypothetical protein